MNDETSKYDMKEPKHAICSSASTNLTLLYTMQCLTHDRLYIYQQTSPKDSLIDVHMNVRYVIANLV